MKICVLITTYNKPRYLEKVLAGYGAQQGADFELAIADDGSGPETRAVIEAFAASAPFPVRHVWHEDAGFRKTIILNRAIATSDADYLIFTDDDCLPRADFVSVHARLARPSMFLSGGVDYLPRTVSESMTIDDVASQRAFDPAWLRMQGATMGLASKVTKQGRWGSFFDRISPTRPSFNGHNSSVWRSDVVAVNGFDETFGYGGLDRELGARLENAGIRGSRIRFRAHCLHLDHDRPYRDEARVRQNRKLIDELYRRGTTRTEHGLDRLDASAPARQNPAAMAIDTTS